MIYQWITKVFGHVPSQCVVCRTWPAATVCEKCVNRFAQPLPRCQTCAYPLSIDAARCQDCLSHPPPLDACFAAVTYDYPWSRMIIDFKFHNQSGYANAFALLLLSTPWIEPALEAADIVIPMPLSKNRLQTRGYNQALLLAQQVCPEKTHPRLLLRIKNTLPQSGLARTERLASVQNVFAIDPLMAEKIQGARVVLMDDVMTSGASLFSAARTLKAAGAAHITGVVLARTH